MILVTGGSGMIGSNIVHGLNAAGHDDILVVDDLTDGHKFINIATAKIADYEDKDDFLDRIDRDEDLGISVIFHQGACSTTTEWNGRYMMKNNYEYSKKLLDYALRHSIPFIYASSAAVYGGGKVFRDDSISCEMPLNVYGWSKKLFDDYVRRTGALEAGSPVVGLRYFNVYGPHEAHKGSMASVAFHLHDQIRRGEKLKLFDGFDGYEAGEQRRDFVHVEDVVAVNLWCWQTGISGIFNCGTGHAEPFKTIAETIIKENGKGTIEYIAFPEHLKGRYQSFTEADISKLRAASYKGTFRDVATGVSDYFRWLEQHGSS